MADKVWIQLYVGEEKSGQVFSIEIASLSESIIDDLANAVHQAKSKSLGHCDAADLEVYKAGTEFPANEDDKLRPRKPVPDDTASKNPLRAVAPAKELSNQPGTIEEQLLTALKKLRKLMEDERTDDRPMSEATFMFAKDLLKAKGITTSADFVAESDSSGIDIQEWGKFVIHTGEVEETENTRAWLQERLFGENEQELGIFNVTHCPLPTVSSNGKRSAGTADLAIGDKAPMEHSINNKDDPFRFTKGLIELKTKNELWNVGQSLLQLFALSTVSHFKTGVCLLSADCDERWEVYNFSSGAQILRTGYRHGSKAGTDFMQLIKTVGDRARQFEASRLTRVRIFESQEDNEQDLSGFELSEEDEVKSKALEDEAMLERFADQLGTIYGERPVIPTWARADSRCPHYYS